MMDPWESLRVHVPRQILLGENGTNAAGGPELDVYDILGRLPRPPVAVQCRDGHERHGDASALPSGEVLKGA